MAHADEENSLRGQLLFEVPMAEYVSWRAGGKAKQMYKPADLADLVQFLQQLSREEPLLWIGRGSNLLVRDGGFPGTVIATAGRLTAMENIEPGLVRVEAGISCAKVARTLVRQSLVGVEFLIGIPGCMGGALAMNAGAFGGETWELVERVETIDNHGTIRLREKAEFEVTYRQVSGPEGEYFVAAHLRLEEGDRSEAEERITLFLSRKNRSQPTQKKTCGSVFRNPEGGFAAQLIESVGLKGATMGGAVVSDQHANFIENCSGASATDIERLITLIQQKVDATYGVLLEPEVCIVGVK